MLKTIAISLFSLGLVTAAVAQTKAPTAPSMPPVAAKSAAECETNWKAVDKNSDGRLDKAEMDANKAIVPVSLSTASAATHQEFLTACENPTAAKK